MDAVRVIVAMVAGRHEGVVGGRQSGVIADVINVIILRQQ